MYDCRYIGFGENGFCICKYHPVFWLALLYLFYKSLKQPEYKCLKAFSERQRHFWKIIGTFSSSMFLLEDSLPGLVLTLINMFYIIRTKFEIILYDNATNS